MTPLQMVQDALSELGDEPAQAVAAFVESRYGARIDPRFIPLFKATIQDQERRTTQVSVALVTPATALGVTVAGRRASTSPRACAARQLALHLMAVYGLHGWTFRFNRCKRAMGLCVFQRRTIELSIYFVERDNPDDEIRDTILHEIAHALVGPGHGHDRVWKRKCIEIGARPLRCGLADMPEGKWRAHCAGCGREFHRHRKPQRARGWFCRGCGPRRGRLLWNASA